MTGTPDAALESPATEHPLPAAVPVVVPLATGRVVSVFRGAAVFSLFMVLAATALAMKATSTPFPGEETRFFKAYGIAPDLYNFVKARLLLVGAPVALALASGAWFLDVLGLGRGPGMKARFKVHLARNGSTALLALAPVFALSFWVWICARASTRPALTALGFLELFDGTAVQLCYLGVCVAAFALARTGALARSLPAGLAVCSLSVSAVGFLQYAGRAPWDWAPLGGWLLGTADGALRVMPIWGAGSFSATLYNPNWAGAFFALVTPVAAGVALRTGSRARIAAASLWFAACFVALVCSGSRASFFGVVAGSLFLVPDAVRAPRRCAMLVAVAIAAIITFPSHRGSSMAEELGGSALRENLTAYSNAPTRRAARVERVESLGNAFVLEWRGTRAIIMESAPGALVARDDAGREIPLRATDEGWRAAHPGFHDLALVRRPDEESNRYGGSWTLALGGARVDVAFTHMGARVKLLGAHVAAQVPAAFPSWMPDGFASYRGYIWKRTLPLVARSPWIGYGPGAFADEFPQNDVAGKLSTLGVGTIVDKPHNAYLQQAVAFGLPGLALFLCVVALAFAGLLRGGERNARARTDAALGRACAAGLAAHLGASLAVDESVGVAPFLWLVLGFGLARLVGDDPATARMRPDVNSPCR